MGVAFHPTFVRQLKKLSPAIQEDVIETVEIIKQDWRHTALKTHKLRGELSDYYSAKVNYSHRIIFEIHKNNIYLLEVGDHDLYK